MPAGSNAKRERQYKHIKESQKKQGKSEKRAKEVAARTVNKERARSGEAKSSSKTSTSDMSSGRRGGQRSGTNRAEGAHPRTALRGGEEAEHLRPLLHEQGAAAQGGRRPEVGRRGGTPLPW